MLKNDVEQLDAQLNWKSGKSWRAPKPCLQLHKDSLHLTSPCFFSGMAFPSAPMLSHHRHFAANRASPAVGRASPADVRASPAADRAADDRVDSG